MIQRILTIVLSLGLLFSLILFASKFGSARLPGNQQGYEPVQPIAYSHRLHAGELKMDCLYCHSGANKAPDPGNASVQTCMGCHLVVKAGSAEIKKVADYYNKGLPIPWNRVHKVPDYVQFPHMRHVNAGVTCQSCHGDIAAQGKQGPDTNYVPVQQAKSLNMGWCINCHVNGYKPVEGAKAAGIPITPAIEAMPIKKARYDCAVCHY